MQAIIEQAQVITQLEAEKQQLIQIIREQAARIEELTPTEPQPDEDEE